MGISYRMLSISKQDIENNPAASNIYTFTVEPVELLLRSHIQQSPAFSTFHCISIKLRTESKISHFYLEFLAFSNQDVLRLDISMNYVLWMHILDCLQNSFHNRNYLGTLKTIFSDKVSQVAAVNNFHH